MVPAVERLPVSTCRICGYAFDCATDVRSDARPKPWDVSLCLQCAAIGIYDGNMRVVEPPLLLLLELEHDPEIRRVREHLVRHGPGIRG